MGCCVAEQESEVVVKKGDMFKYSILVSPNSNETWELANEENLRTLKDQGGKDERDSSTDPTKKSKQINFKLKAQQAGQETLVFARYSEGSRNPKAYKKVKVKVI